MYKVTFYNKEQDKAYYCIYFYEIPTYTKVSDMITLMGPDFINHCADLDLHIGGLDEPELVNV
jgi:hypothetical protein